MIALAVFIGGGLGALTRYQVSRLLPSAPLPWGTLAVNVLGCLVLGLLVPIFAAREDLSPALRTGITTGVLGGLTTFSTFGVETLRAWQSAPHLGMINLGLNLVVGLSAAGVGLWLGGRLA